MCNCNSSRTCKCEPFYHKYPVLTWSLALLVLSQMVAVWCNFAGGIQFGTEKYGDSISCMTVMWLLATAVGGFIRAMAEAME